MNDSSLKSKKTKVVALSVWLGTRLMDYSDLHAFGRESSTYRGFSSFQEIVFPEIDLRVSYGWSYLPILKEMIKEIARMTAESEHEIAIFFILSAQAAESVWYNPFMKVVEKTAPQCQIYKIIMGGGFSSELRRRKDTEPYWPEEIRAHELGAIYSYFSSDAPTNAARRLIELINRIMGCDLPDKRFPNYTDDDLKKIAYNISREDFNSLGIPRQGAIPKYEIKNGRPVFQI